MGRPGFTMFKHDILTNDKVRDFIDEHPAEFAVWFLSVQYCAREQSDGLLTLKQAVRFLGLKDSGAAQVLVDARMWDDRGDDSFYVHDYLDYQADMAQLSQARAVAGSRGGRQRAINAGQDIKTKQTQASASKTKQSASKTKLEQEQEQEQEQENTQVVVVSDVSNRARGQEAPPPRGIRVDGDWRPDEAGERLARQLGLDLEAQRQAFIDYNRSVGKPSGDLQALFRRFLRSPKAQTGRLGVADREREMSDADLLDYALSRHLEPTAFTVAFRKAHRLGLSNHEALSAAAEPRAQPAPSPGGVTGFDSKGGG